MVRPNYLDYRNSQFIFSYGHHLGHSAKGSTWEEHKYIKRIDGTYYYPDNYKGGRHLPDGEKSDGSDEDNTSIEDQLFKKLKKSSSYEDIGKTLRGSFDKVLREELGIDWTKLPKEEVDRMQRSIIDRLENKVDSSDDSEDDEEETGFELSEDDVEKLAKEVIIGNFGNGQVRKDLLGDNYSKIQKRVNELMKGSTGSMNVSEATEESIKKAEKAADKTVTNAESNSVRPKAHSGVAMDEVLSVYKKKK